MAAADRVLLGALAALAAFVGVQVVAPRTRTESPRPVGSAPPGSVPSEPAPAEPATRAPGTPLPTYGTYLPDILAAQDSVLVRWRARGPDAPVRVWVQPESPVDGWTPRLVQPARDAVLTWDQARLPVRLALADDSATADVRVTWVHSLEPPRIGVARVQTTVDGYIVDGTLRLAVRRADGSLLPESTVRATALHEVGHLLGLNHARDVTAIMASHVTQLDRLAPADLATARLLYQLPPGKLR